MPDEVTQGESIVLTGDQIEHGRWLRLRIMLKTEIKTTMRHSRGSVMLEANKLTGNTVKSKKAAYAALNKFIVEKLGPDFDKPLT